MAENYFACTACPDVLPLRFEVIVAHISSHIQNYQSMTSAILDQLQTVLRTVNICKGCSSDGNLPNDGAQVRGEGDREGDGEGDGDVDGRGLTKGRPFKCPDCGSAFARTQDLKRHYQRLHYPCDENCPACSWHFFNADQLIIHRCADEPSPDLRREISGRRDTVVKEISTKLKPKVETLSVRSYMRKRRRSGRPRSHSPDHPTAGPPKGNGTSAEVVSLSMRTPGLFVDDGSESLAVDNQAEALEQSQSKTPTDRVFQSNEGDVPPRTDQSFTGLGAFDQNAQNSGTISGPIGDSQYYRWESGQAAIDPNQMISNRMQHQITICGLMPFLEAEAQDGSDPGMRPIEEVSRWSSTNGARDAVLLKRRANVSNMSARLMEPHVRDTRHTKAPDWIRAQGAVRTFSIRAWSNANCWKQGGQILSTERSV
ncbi:hypothetical protein B0T17DRAFT_505488 [Bombardia bombarda]|uniref:C2H2-type domain-containing protein n=1 Tax=Bombardia bombarda TaxID=252184 RepID=A0AA39X7R1_9PEZI|nr:hypothetical protein B0T17DRAFT_505488 [Bombardia bombarda]